VRSQAPLTAHSFALVLGYLALYAAGAAALVASSIGLSRLRPRVAASLIAAGCGLVLLVTVVNPGAVRSRLEWIFGGVPAAVAIAAIVLVVRHVVRRRPLDARGQTLLATLAVLAVLAAKTYSGFFFLAERAQPAVYAAPFVFVVLARLHLVDLARTRMMLATGTAWLAVLAVVCLGLTLKDAHAQSASVTGPGGTLQVSTVEAPLYRAALDAIASSTRAGEPILISLVPGALAKPGDEQAAIRSLTHVRFAITDRHSFGEYGQTRFGKSFDRLLATWVQRNFDHAATLKPRGSVDHTLDVWVRRAP
jgi:hypothetical protein